MFPIKKFRVKTFDGREIDWRWDPYFSLNEPGMRSGGNGEIIVDPLFFDRILKLRKWCDFPFPVSSFYRDPEYNAQVSSTGLDGPHTRGAIDIRVYGERAHILLGHALTMGFLGIGISQKGPHASRFIHLDGREQRAIWSY